MDSSDGAAEGDLKMTDTEKISLISKMIVDFREYNETEDMRSGAVAMVTAINSVVEFEEETAK